jgi:hypothetical protein
MVFPPIHRNRDVSGPQEARQGEKQMKKSVLTIALAVATALVLSQPAALAKNPKGGAPKTTAAKKHHKKHMKKSASAVAPAANAV